MPIIISKERCNGCRACTEICPGDLIAFNNKTRKAYIPEPSDCWECFSCVKVCPRTAIEIVLPYQIAYYKASLTARFSKDKKSLLWILKKQDEGEVKKKVFEIKTREF